MFLCHYRKLFSFTSSLRDVHMQGCLWWRQSQRLHKPHCHWYLDQPPHHSLSHRPLGLLDCSTVCVCVCVCVCVLCVFLGGWVGGWVCMCVYRCQCGCIYSLSSTTLIIESRDCTANPENYRIVVSSTDTPYTELLQSNHRT